MGRLTASTIVRNPDTSEVVVLTAGQELPEWAVGQVGDHLLGGPEGAPAGAKGGGKPSGGASAPASEPPRAGRGSGLEPWTAYAESLGIDVPEDASRDDVIELVDQHNEN